MHPPVFSDLSFDDALAKAGDRIVLVDAMASWCQPCKHMDKTTWVDAGVVATIGKHGVAIQFDVDEHKELAKKLAVRAMPTVIAFRDGKEVDRIVGMRGPADFVAWIEGLARGETSLDAARASAKANPDDIKGRMTLSRILVERAAFDEAIDVHEKLWADLDASPQLVMVKHAIFDRQLAELVEAHAPARAAFTRIRDASAVGSRDWITLNRVLGQNERTLSWYESVRDRVAGDPELEGIVESSVIPLLVAEERWADAGRAIIAPMTKLDIVVERKKRAAAGVASLPPDQAKQALAMLDMMNLEELKTLRRALAAAGRDEELRSLEEAAAKVDPAWVEPLPN